MAKLYIISTPIGNSADITLRALEVLKNIPIILCEDTRVTKKLLRILDIESKNKKLLSYYEHNERSKIRDVISLLNLDYDIALVSDAGTPLISDPGFPLINYIQNLSYEEKEKIQIEVVPGPSSVLTALLYSGLPSDKFTFLGFIPRKPGDRKKFFQQIRKSYDFIKSTYITFENLNRLSASLDTMKLILGNKIEVCLCRELTKLHEEIVKGDIDEIIFKIKNKEINLKGELVIVFSFKY